MPTFDVETYELHVHKYRVNARDVVEALEQVAARSPKAKEVKDGTYKADAAADYGMSWAEFTDKFGRETAQRLPTVMATASWGLPGIRDVSLFRPAKKTAT